MNSYKIMNQLVFTIFLLGVSQWGWAMKWDNKNNAKYFSVEISNLSGVHSRVSLNDVVLHLSRGKQMQSSSNYPKHFLIKGKNSLSVELFYQS